ncbi:ABC transporter ATP-binding protein [Geovibrio thiophilus]|uniref:ABC transporter ATP-binding protein n=1 Tax=Geovibrio thiophilus TaxID=139438 RepID=A0A3R5XW92_9BACT|nr:ABC transporter ATP-binding protein [Geovibrio thiophilus]QAR32182.1 ABC transporter ATP-binding protein [Geovibrio thiophilus]
MSCTLSLNSISCRTADKILFENVSINLTHKDKIAVLGPNGAGKTTLLKAIVGLGAVCGGHVEIHHRKLVTEKDFTQARREIGFLFQDPDDQIIAPTVIEEVAFGLLNDGMKQPEAVAKAEAMLSELHIRHLRDRVTLNLSGGEKKMVALASVLVMKPEILLLDEPSAALDKKSEDKLAEILRDIDKTMLIVSHDLNFIEKIGARKMFLTEKGLVEG